jgi:AraC-like DNA-binding protein
MKPSFEKVLFSETSFLVKEEHFNRFDISWHLHPEYELAFIYHVEGKINIGDYFSNIEDPELILLGPNLPHRWFGNMNAEPEPKSKQLIIQFPHDFLGKDFFDKHDLSRINELLNRSARGLSFNDAGKKGIGLRIRKMLYLPDFERVMELLSILNVLAQSKNYRILSSIGYFGQLNQNESFRLNNIYKFILENFRNDIGLDSVARHASMTPQGFSKYFKERTKKNFITFLNEVKIGHACRLITEKKMNMSQICYECGFTNLSNFNRQFKRSMNLTPTQFAKQFE